jgi:hypothetical protein
VIKLVSIIPHLNKFLFKYKLFSKIKMPRYLIHWFTTCSGGLCDRILGLSASICIAKMLNMKILIKWDHTDLSSGFKINKEFNWYENQCEFKKVIFNNLEYRDYFKDENIIEKWGNDNILIWSNMNLFHYALQNPHLKHIIPSNYIEKMSEAIHLVLEEIFIINKNILDNVPVYDKGIHIRTGDNQIYNKDKEESYREYIVNIFKKIKDFTNDNDNFFISSDCLLSFKIAEDCFKNFEYNKGSIVHTNQEINEDGLNKVLLDLLTLCKCKNELYIGWHSNFSRISALYNLNRKFICYEYENSPVIKEFSNEVLFSYFSWGK